MLTDKIKAEIRGELFRGNPQTLLEGSRRTDDPPFYQTIAFMIDELRRYHELPNGKNCVFHIRFDPRFGAVSVCGDWHDGGWSWIQFEGSDTRYPDAPLPGHLADSAAAKIFGIRYRPRRETRRAAATNVKPDFKLAQAHDER